jgi:hypothetical protein
MKVGGVVVGYFVVPFHPDIPYPLFAFTGSLFAFTGKCQGTHG